jgi:hypothetical protein
LSAPAVHEGRGEAGVGPDEGDAAGQERIVSERPGQKEERRQEDERLLGDADRPAADGEDDGEQGHDERLVPPEPPDQGADAGLDDPRPVEDAEGAADDEYVEDDLGDLTKAAGEGEDERAQSRRPGFDGVERSRVDNFAALVDDPVVASRRDDPGRDGGQGDEPDEQHVGVRNAELHRFMFSSRHPARREAPGRGGV